jgi:hypothetical protein
MKIGLLSMDKFDFFFIQKGEYIVFSPLRSENDLNTRENFI